MQYDETSETEGGASESPSKGKVDRCVEPELQQGRFIPFLWLFRVVKWGYEHGRNNSMLVVA